MNEVTKAKAIVALVGTIATALLGTIPPNTTLWTVLTFVVALCTAVGVHQVPNKTKNQKGAADAGLLLLVLTFVGVVLLLFRVHFGG